MEENLIVEEYKELTSEIACAQEVYKATGQTGKAGAKDSQVYFWAATPRFSVA